MKERESNQAMLRNAKSLSERLIRELWEKDIEQRSQLERLGVRLARLLYGIARKCTDSQLTMRAMSLVYTTLLSLVPLLAVSFSVLRAFGVRNQLEPFLIEFLAPLGEQGEEIAASLLGFVENIQVGILGSLGIALLFFTVLSLIHKVEEAFNTIWLVPSTRSLSRRFSDYLSVILIGPVLVFSALGITASVMSSTVVQWFLTIEPFGTVLLGISRLIPYLLVCAAFVFIYGFVPNTRVRPGAAIAGGLFAGVLWYTTGLLFAHFVAGSSNYSAIYSGFAGAILFMIWLYVGWLIVLVGAWVAFYWQNPHVLNPLRENAVVGDHRRETLALEIMTLIGRAHYRDEPPWTLEALERHYPHVQSEVLAALMRSLEAQGLIVATHEEPPSYVPGHDIETISLREVMRVARGAAAGTGSDLTAVSAVMERVDAAIARVLAERTVKDLALSGQVQKKQVPAASGSSEV
ncbi:MAG: YihY/virulence factor BrkB family protein [Gammaproteobacteria bacterium]